ncbi:DNA polymerase III subunit delta [Candidatus Nanoperiomorbus periodonticus]|uniref:DNA polymerase III subunit delta n=1 Tax=Candidatus Nanoperiomorbus periodonticus TaxID=2171989 RepID=UPI00101C6E92|nr:hypothetical protein [Candidatus Nanoperiomorbus periodonticus]RYC75667.1 hypothetical protein G51EAM_00619 [Candidatus Nanoperiomorbus periodonticus]RYC76079.1 hypothetical protein G51EAM_00483 [Candidatus Nanoperiomorbus periodonticus]
MIYFLHGDNDYLINRRVKELRQAFAREHSPDAITTIDGTEVAPADLTSQLTALSLFDPYRLIIVSAVTAQAGNWTMLETNLAHISEQTTVILTDIKALSKVRNLTITRTMKELRRLGATIEKFDLAKSSYQLRPWLETELERHRLSVKQGVTDKLLELTAGEENQQARLELELDKLALLGDELTVRLVEQYVQPSPQTNAFAILEAGLAGDQVRVAQLLDRLIMAGEDSNRFLGLLASQALALAGVLTGAKVKLSPYQLNQTRQLAERLGDRQLSRRLGEVVEKLARLDGKTKQSTPDQAWVYIRSTLSNI